MWWRYATSNSDTDHVGDRVPGTMIPFSSSIFGKRIISSDESAEVWYAALARSV